MRRTLTLLATVSILIGLIAAPASADKPAEFRVDFTVNAGNPVLPLNDPCTGLDMGYMDIYLIIREHQGHKKNLTGIVKGYGVTGSGYVLSGSPDHLMIKGDPETDGLVVSGFNDMWTNPNGDKMQMRAIFVMKDGVVRVDKFTSRCVGGRTIDPLP
jgi:hypothetical protein